MIVVFNVEALVWSRMPLINNNGWRVTPVKPLLEEEESKISFAAASIERYVSEVRLA